MMMSNDEPAREKPEDELLHSTAVLRSLPNGVVICDRAGIVRFINPAGTRLLGLDIEQWLNRPLVDLPHGAALSLSAVGQIAKISVEGVWLNYRVVPVWSSKHPSQQIGRLVLFDERPSQQEASQYLLAVISHELRAVRDILWKLIDNAYHYTLPNGQIQVRVQRVSRQIRVDIVDTGIGISDAAKPHIFADFVHDYYNPLSSQVHYFHGVGMSLVIVRKLVELYGGSIWFESSVGQGSTFSFTLPISEFM